MSEKRKPRRSSVVWSIFSKKSYDVAECKLCQRDVKNSGNTTNLNNHMKRYHKLYMNMNEFDNTCVETLTVINEVDNDGTMNISNENEQQSETVNSQKARYRTLLPKPSGESDNNVEGEFDNIQNIALTDEHLETGNSGNQSVRALVKKNITSQSQSTEPRRKSARLSKKVPNKASSNELDVISTPKQYVKFDNPDDEYDNIGKYVAHKLRKLPPSSVVYAERIIMDALFKAQLGFINEHSTVFTPQDISQADQIVNMSPVYTQDTNTDTDSILKNIE